MRQVVSCLQDVMFCVTYALLLVIGFALFVVLAVAMRPLLIAALVLAAASALVLPHWSQGCRTWFDSLARP